MARGMIAGRAFERSLPRGGRKFGARKYYYERLMQVVVRHTYYPGPDFACPDFKAIPTPDSAALMKDLGMQFLQEPYGFSIVYDQSRQQDLFDYLRRQASQGEPDVPKEDEVWTRISVVLALSNPYFINFTGIPIDTDPISENFYFSNLDAHRLGESILLAPGKAVSQKELEKVIPPQYAVSITDPDVTAIEVRDVSHHVVLCRPRCIPRNLASQQNPVTVTCQNVQDFTKACQEACAAECLKRFPDNPTARKRCEKECARKNEDLVCVDTIYLDFSPLPEGRYSVEQVRQDPRSGEETVINKEDVLYTLHCPAPLCFIDLFLTDPMPGITENGIYPVRNLFDKKHTEIVEVSYELKFLARSTLWNYFIVPQPQRHFEDLSIRSDTGPGFLGPCPVVLANGAQAYRFLSAKAIPLRKYSNSKFQLWNRGAILEQRLPVASTQVLPRNGLTACRNLLASLEHQAEDLPPCLELRDHLCPDCKGLPRSQCEKRLNALSHAANSSLEKHVSLRRNYSDIFVYV